MAKNKQKQRKPAAKKKTPRARARLGKPNGPKLTAYQGLILDPCSGPLVSPYGGDRGYITRFTQDVTINTGAGITSGCLQFFPGQELIISGSGATGASGFTLGSQNGPGQSFLNTTASAVRCVAACMEVIPSGATYNNLSGEIGFGYVDWNTAGTGAGVSTNQMFQLCTARTVLSKKTFEAKWSPGPSDHMYSSQVPGGACNPPVTTARGLLLCWRDCPANVGVTLRFTSVLEWRPDMGVGIANNSQPAPGIDHHKQVADLATKGGSSWWHNLMEEAGMMAGRFATGAFSEFAAAGKAMLLAL